MNILNKFIQNRKIKKEILDKKKLSEELDIIIENWRYEDDKKLYVYDGKELIEEMTFREYVDRQVKDAKCECRKKRKYWELMLSTGQVYPLKSCPKHPNIY